MRVNSYFGIKKRVTTYLYIWMLGEVISLLLFISALFSSNFYGAKLNKKLFIGIRKMKLFPAFNI